MEQNATLIPGTIGLGMLPSRGLGKSVSRYNRGANIYAQGDSADAVYYVVRGKVTLHIVSPQGKEAIIGFAGAGEYFGETCLIDNSCRNSTAIALENSTVMRIEKQELKYDLRHSFDFSQAFICHLLSRKVRLEESLAEQAFSCSEQRLARLLLVLAGPCQPGEQTAAAPRISQNTLASMVGTTRSRISYFLVKFRRAGLLTSNRGLSVNVELMENMLRSESRIPPVRSNGGAARTARRA